MSQRLDVITGSSGFGKSSLARALQERLLQIASAHIVEVPIARCLGVGSERGHSRVQSIMRRISKHSVVNGLRPSFEFLRRASRPVCSCGREDAPEQRSRRLPIHEYSCDDCGRAFEALVRSGTVPTGPQCGSMQLRRQLSVFATAADGEPAAAIAAPCGTCGHPDGPGSSALR
jgi:putative FmdB family regulatory protein